MSDAMADYEIRSPTSPTSPKAIGKPTADTGLQDIYALVIGINAYQCDEYPNLEGAVPDANEFAEFLRERLRVPASHIIDLRDERASRAGILAAFDALRDDVRFGKDEAAIVIYYAGHGAKTSKPEEWRDEWATSEPEIEMLCPADVGTVVRRNGADEVVPGIPDRTVSCLLNHLSDIKGDNITLILDCCNSAGLNRAAQGIPPDCVPRGIQDPPPISARCDEVIISRQPASRSARVAIGFGGKHHGSHVLLAACGRNQSAYEKPRNGRHGGLFTGSLLTLLNADGGGGGLTVNDLTYLALMHKLNMPNWQSPHCEGLNVHRRLFNKRAPGADGSFVLGKKEVVTKQDGSKAYSYVLKAGAAQGVTVDSTYSIHASDLISDATHLNDPLATLTVNSVQAFVSELSRPTRKLDQKLFYCRLVKRATLGFKVYCSDMTRLETAVPREALEHLSITFVDDPEQALFHVLFADDGNVRFERNDPLITPHIGAKLPHLISQDDGDKLYQVLRSASHFYHHLLRESNTGFEHVWMDLRTLNISYNKEFDQVLTPVEENLLKEEPTVVVVDEHARLGMAIHNETDIPLYPHLFYFDPSDLVIINWYTPPFGAGGGKLTTVDPPLPGKSQLTVGYGGGGVTPWQFLLRDGEDKDVGFFKLFLTTSPADFSSLPQDSPFETSASRYGKPASAKLPEVHEWGTKMSTVIQVRTEDLMRREREKYQVSSADSDV